MASARAAASSPPATFITTTTSTCTMSFCSSSLAGAAVATSASRWSVESARRLLFESGRLRSTGTEADAVRDSAPHRTAQGAEGQVVRTGVARPRLRQLDYRGTHHYASARVT